MAKPKVPKRAVSIQTIRFAQQEIKACYCGPRQFGGKTIEEWHHAAAKDAYMELTAVLDAYATPKPPKPHQLLVPVPGEAHVESKPKPRLRPNARLAAILGHIDSPNYTEMSDYETENHRG